MKNSLYEYSYQECIAVKMPNEEGYTWYDIAMFDTCKQMVLILLDNVDLYDDDLYISLKDLNDFMMNNIAKDKHIDTIEHRYNFLNKLCTVQISEITSKHRENPQKYATLVNAFNTYYDCLCEFKTLNGLEIKTLEIIKNRELFSCPHTRMLFDKMAKVTTNIGANQNDIKLLNDAYTNAYYEIQKVHLSKDTKKAAIDYLKSTQAYLDILINVQKYRGRK